MGVYVKEFGMSVKEQLGGTVLSDRVRPVVTYIATGGTIAMKRDAESKAPVPAVEGQDLLNEVEGLNQYARVEVDNFSNTPSVGFGPAEWVALHQRVSQALDRPEVAAVIVSHGTDTMEETAYFLDLTLDSSKPVILFGAQRNASEKDSDGPRNLFNAVRVGVSDDARDKGVMIVMNHQISAARDVTKTHTTDINSFQSGNNGFLGRVDDDQVMFDRSPARRRHIALQAGRQADRQANRKKGSLCRVDIVAMYGGADDLMMQAAINAGAKGIVIQALGAGNVNSTLFVAIREAIEAGVKVVIASRVPKGRVQPIYGYQGGGQSLAEIGAVFADDLSPQKARILLMLALQEDLDRVSLQHLFK